MELEHKLKEKIQEQEEITDKLKNIDYLNESVAQKINSLKGHIVHSPEKLQSVLEELKIKNEAINTQVEEIENNIKNYERNLKILDVLIKHFNYYEGLLEDLEKINMNSIKIEEVIYLTQEEILKKEKGLNEIFSKIDNLDKSLRSLTDYLEDFYQKQKKAAESKDENISQIREKLSLAQKKLTELNDLLKSQLNTNISIEEKVRFLITL
jgi:chromosome segregation ATPase